VNLKKTIFSRLPPGAARTHRTPLTTPLPSVPSMQQRRAAGLLLCDSRAGDIDHSAAIAGSAMLTAEGRG